MKPKSALPGRSSKPARKPAPKQELVVITGLSGSGKGSVLRALEDLGFYSVDNLPVDLIPKFAELTRDNPGITSAALVVDVREGKGLKRLPEVFSSIRNSVNAKLIFLEADDAAIVRRFSETRRPHPLGAGRSIPKSIRSERAQLAPIRAMADLIINTSKFTVHELREFIGERFRGEDDESKILIYVTSFGYRKGIPPDSDLVFDVRFLPNPNYIPRFKNLTGRNPGVARYIRSFPANRGIHQAHHRTPDLPAAALYPRGQELPDHRLRLHRRAASVGNDGRPDWQEPGASRLQGQGKSSGYCGGPGLILARALGGIGQSTKK